VAWLRASRRVDARTVSTVAAVAIVGLGAVCVVRSLVWRSATSLWERTVRDAPTSSRAWEGLALAYALHDQPREAIAAATDGLARFPNLPRLLMARGIGHSEIGENETALVDLTAAAPRMNGRDLARLYNNLGVVEMRLERLTDAEQSLRHALAIAGDFDVARRHLAETLEAQGRIDEADVEYRRALALAPHDQSIRDKLRALSARTRP
jgi:Tfp pilus assembly protein PilF